jgi:hypothetical protein
MYICTFWFTITEKLRDDSMGLTYGSLVSFHGTCLLTILCDSIWESETVSKCLNYGQFLFFHN